MFFLVFLCLHFFFSLFFLTSDHGPADHVSHDALGADVQRKPREFLVANGSGRTVGPLRERDAQQEHLH